VARQKSKSTTRPYSLRHTLPWSFNLAGLLYGVEATDTPTFTTVTLALLVIGFVACAAPSLRAVFVEPSIVLRSE
jgi:hypothetical protein